ncbi:MAG: hypothetical protein Q8M98_09880 [Candidatus Cloacimonadaceae bacterium]|nr:hypothetical protein [Candidatus Cloacimonadaceae bacterium]
MSSEKIMTADEIRLELTRRRMTRRELARHLGMNYDYIVQILLGYRNAAARREQITNYFNQSKQIKELRGLS